MVQDETETKDARVVGGVAAVVIAFVGLSLGSTIAKSVHAPGAVVAFWRFFVGAIVWHAIIAVNGVRRGEPRLAGREAWRAAALPGIAFGINLACFFSGVARTPIAHAEFISALAPIVLVPIAAKCFGERVQRPVVVAGAFAIGGVALILSRSSAAGTSYTGDALVVAAMISWVAYLLLAKGARTRVSTSHFMAVMSTVACLTTLPIALSTTDLDGLTGLPGRSIMLIAVLALVNGVVAHGLITWAQQRVAVGTISILQLAQPGLGVLWAGTFLGEAVALVQIVGMVVVLSAVGVIARRSVQEAPQP